MSGKVNYIIACLSIVFLASCEKEEPLWKLPPAGDETQKTISMGDNYENVIFFQLSTGNAVIKNLMVWDLAFASGSTEHHVVMNGGKSVQVYNTHDSDFFKTTYTASTTSPWQWDNPNGDKDSTAFGEWLDVNNASKKEVYILDMGQSASPQYRKLQLLSVNTTSYMIRYSNLDGSDFHDMAVSKSTDRNYTYVNLPQCKEVDYEPENTQWDIVFTKYRHVYYDMNPITPYSVTGVLINTKYVTVNETNTLTFDNITAENASTLAFTSKADEIGFDWKTFDFGTSKYTVSPTKIYILKDKSGYLYKLRFIDFYDDKGAKGYPTFIYKRL